MPRVINIAPRVLVYPHGTSPPPVEEGWLALPQLSATASAETLGLASPSPSKPAQSRGFTLSSAAAGRAKRAPPRRAVFGDGSHPTTRLCAAAVDLLCRQRPGMAVLDVGTGTGILARIAHARGASFVAGTDIDPAAVACAKANAELDIIASRGANGPRGAAIGPRAEVAMCEPVPAGPIDIHFGDESPDFWGARFDLVVANILEGPLHSLAPALCRALAPRGALVPGGMLAPGRMLTPGAMWAPGGGTLVISGFTRAQVPALRLAYETAGLQPAGDFTLDGWALLKFTAPTQADHY